MSKSRVTFMCQGSGEVIDVPGGAARDGTQVDNCSDSYVKLEFVLVGNV